MGAHLISERWPKKRQGVEEHARTVWHGQNVTFYCATYWERSAVCVFVCMCVYVFVCVYVCMCVLPLLIKCATFPASSSERKLQAALLAFNGKVINATHLGGR